MRLLTSQKNTIYDYIESSELSPLQFDLLNIDRKTKLIYKGEEYFFEFSLYKNDIFVQFSPGDESYNDFHLTRNWDSTLLQFTDWLYYLKREINIPNKWTRLQNEMKNVGINYSDNQDYFTAREHEDLKLNILTLKEGINSLGLLPNQIEALNSKLDHLTDLAMDMNKFDWKSLFIGTIFSVISSLAFSPENSKALWILIKQVFNNYFLP